MKPKKILESILEVYNINATELAEKIEVQRSGLSHIMTGRNNLSLDFIVKIKNTFPELRWDFLIHGKLPMFERDERKKENHSLKMNENNDLFQEKHGVGNSSPSLFDEIGEEVLQEIQPEKGEISKGLKKIEQIVIFYTDGSFTAYQDNSLQ